MEPTRTFSRDRYAQALESWAWTGADRMTPLFTSPFGDVFLAAEDGLYWLDTLRGTLTRRWSGRGELTTDLAAAAGQDEFLLLELAEAAHDRGLVPGPEEVYGFVVPPVLGGAFDASNVEVIDFVVSLTVSGQIHEQVKDLPPGTRITGISVE